MKQKYENIIVTVFMICSLIFDYVCKTKTWEYPDYMIMATEISVLNNWRIALAFAFLMSFFAVFVLRITERTLIKERRFIRMSKKLLYFQERDLSHTLIVFKRLLISSSIILIATAVFCFFRGYKFSGFIYLLQRIISASYVLICYEIAVILHNTICPKERAVVLYFIVHFMFVIFCSWLDYAKIFYLNPLNVTWLASVFSIVYIKVFKDSPTLKQKLMSFGSITIFQIFLFSFQRLSQIALSVFNPSGRFLTNWFMYRVSVFKAVFTGFYSGVEDITLLNIPILNTIWLGIAFGKWQQMLFIILFAFFLGFFIFILYRHKNEPLISLLILGIIINNILGSIYEVNLLYSANLGVMTSKNLFQLIPLICFMCVNKDGGYESHLTKIN